MYLWQQTGDIYNKSTLRIGNRLVSLTWSFQIHGTDPLALWVTLDARTGPPWRPQARKMLLGGSCSRDSEARGMTRAEYDTRRQVL